jgi:hypothetical protein
MMYNSSFQESPKSPPLLQISEPATIPTMIPLTQAKKKAQRRKLDRQEGVTDLNEGEEEGKNARSESGEAKMIPFAQTNPIQF